MYKQLSSANEQQLQAAHDVRLLIAIYGVWASGDSVAGQVSHILFVQKQKLTETKFKKLWKPLATVHKEILFITGHRDKFRHVTFAKPSRTKPLKYKSYGHLRYFPTATSSPSYFTQTGVFLMFAHFKCTRNVVGFEASSWICFKHISGSAFHSKSMRFSITLRPLSVSWGRFLLVFTASKPRLHKKRWPTTLYCRELQVRMLKPRILAHVISTLAQVHILYTMKQLRGLQNHWTTNPTL